MYYKSLLKRLTNWGKRILCKKEMEQNEEENQEVQAQPIEYPRFIPNTPRGEDKFVGGSQSRLSKAIARYFRSNDSLNEEALPRIIGIEGEWGSGKSNVVKMLKKELSGEYHIFEYDAWGYQEDLQRRSILELLTQNLVKNKILFGKTTVEDLEGNKKDVTWLERLKYFLALKSERESKSYPRVNKGLIFNAAISFLSPAFLVIAYKYNLCSTGLWKIIVVTILQIFSVFLWVIDFRKKRKYRLDYLLAISQNKIDENISYEVLIEEEPTAYKFKEWLQIISDFLEEKKGPKLVVVFDNMDRLSAEKVKKFWSLIHTFFADGGFKNIWAVIPFDRDHLSCAFGNEKEDYTKELTKLFIEKTFPIVYRVAPPVITDYQGIFDELFEEAFGATERLESVKTINRMFRIEKPSTNVRDIISFINEMVALKQEWGESISIENIALFCLKKSQILNNPVKSILSGDYLQKFKLIVNNTSQRQGEIAALVYGVAIEHAQQIPLKEYIENCINEEPGYDINQYAESNVHFDMVLENVVENIDPTNVDKSIFCLNKLTRMVPSRLWEYLLSIKLLYPIEKQEFPKEYKVLLLHLKPDMQKKVISTLYGEVFSFKNFNGADYFNTLYEIDQFIKENGISFDFMSIIQEKEVDSATFIELVKVAPHGYISIQESENLVVCERFGIKTKLMPLDTHLATLLPSDYNFDVARIMRQNLSYGFPELLESVKDCIREKRVIMSNAGAIFETYRVLAPTEERPFSVSLDFNTIQKIHSLLVEHKDLNLDNSGYYDFVAMSLAQGQSVSLIKGGDIARVAEIMEFYSNVDDLIKKSTQSNNPLLNDVLKYMVENKLGRGLPITLLAIFYTIQRRINVSEEILWAYFSEKGLGSILDENCRNVIVDASLYDLTTRIDNKLGRTINKFAIKALSKVPAGALYGRRMYPFDYWNVAIAYLLKVMDSLPDNLIEFCKMVFRDIALGRQDPDLLPDYLISMISRVDSRIESTVIDIKNRFCNGRQYINPAKFWFFEPYFILYGNLIETPDDVVKKIILPVIDDEDCRTLILQQRDFYIDLINKAGASSNEIRKRFRKVITPDSSPELISFVEAIDPSPRAEEDSESKS